MRDILIALDWVNLIRGGCCVMISIYPFSICVLSLWYILKKLLVCFVGDKKFILMHGPSTYVYTNPTLCDRYFIILYIIKNLKINKFYLICILHLPKLVENQ